MLIGVLECLEDSRLNFLTNSSTYLDWERKILSFSCLISNTRKKASYPIILILNLVFISWAKLRTSVDLPFFPFAHAFLGVLLVLYSSSLAVHFYLYNLPFFSHLGHFGLGIYVVPHCDHSQSRVRSSLFIYLLLFIYF